MKYLILFILIFCYFILMKPIKKSYAWIDISDEIIRGRPIKPLTLSLKSSAGRSSLTGRIAVRRRGGGRRAGPG